MDQSSPYPLSVIRTRFAPSPTGYLHLGHACSASYAHDFARRHGGEFLLRMEDIDRTRCRPEFDVAIQEDLKWLGLDWDGPIRRQSRHMEDYQAALDRLRAQDLLYPCFCTRREIQAEIERSGYAPHGLEGMLYPGLCRHLSPQEIETRLSQEKPFALRLDMQRALARLERSLYWHDLLAGPQKARPETLGDVVLARKDIPTSYHLSVVIDDALQKISHVIRGEDLFYATHLHRLLQHLLGLPTPVYAHHPLLLDEKGKRLSKRHKALTLRQMRAGGLTPRDLKEKFPPLALHTA
ncbi:tRNA glutamyl-Q(34) synthetase GluQRS [Luteithermobacter gelatinilyticus]|uniref:tRNA glutamyl-Q(34) synthetase GluQRS n=1 Tax=Luteithermobacter gelatinilyticus TaxID=2582913 RepID=UPI001105C3D1|nr:tRNA glutamyl-Q(34) synthetase GluQRS [Luteithermobacter gelatinilyticus]